MCVCVCVCVCEREREKEREYVLVCYLPLNVCVRVHSTLISCSKDCSIVGSHVREQVFVVGQLRLCGGIGLIKMNPRVNFVVSSLIESDVLLLSFKHTVLYVVVFMFDEHVARIVYGPPTCVIAQLAGNTFFISKSLCALQYGLLPLVYRHVVAIARETLRSMNHKSRKFSSLNDTPGLHTEGEGPPPPQPMPTPLPPENL